MVAINKPVQGELAWGTKLNTVLDTLSTAIDDAVAAHAALAGAVSNVDNVSDAAQPKLIRGDGTKSYRMVSCVLRRVDATTWEAMNDSGHAPTGVTSVTITSTYVQVNYSFTATKVSSWQNTVDEAFAAAGSGGVRCGASVGLTYTRIYFYIGASATPVDPGTLSTAGANVWVTGIFEV